MFEVPQTRYAKSGDVNIAYQVVGDGPFDLIHVPPFVSNLELQWEDPAEHRYFERLRSFSRLIMFDKRGTGLSDRVSVATLEERINDLRAPVLPPTTEDLMYSRACQTNGVCPPSSTD